MKTRIIRLTALLALLLLGACSSSKGSAENAIKAAERTFNSTKQEASQYVPDQVKQVEEALNAAKASFDKGDYWAALTSAKSAASKAKNLAPATAAKKDELEKSWTEMSAGLPKMVNAIRSRVDILSKSKKLPAGLNKAKLNSAKSDLEEVRQTWSESNTAFMSGDIADALAKAKAVKNGAVEIMRTLGMQVPAAASS